MQGDYRCGRENHGKARTKYIYMPLSHSSEAVLKEGQRKGICRCSSLPVRTMEKKRKTFLSHTSVGGEQGDARSTCLAGGWRNALGGEMRSGKRQGRGCNSPTGPAPGTRRLWLIDLMKLKGHRGLEVERLTLLLFTKQINE